jgi:peptide/nickel transport system permease protein
VLAFLVRRIAFAASLVVAVSLAAFCIFGISFDPGFSFYASGSPEAIRAHHIVDVHYHLEDPILSRYWRWASGVVRHHSFGNTVSINVGGAPMHLLDNGTPISPIVVRALEVTAVMVGFALVLVSVLSSLLGSLAARRERFRIDVWARGLAYLGAAVPTFLVGDLLTRALIPKSHGAFVNGRYTLVTTGSWLQPGPPASGIVSWTQHLLLPTLALALGLVGIYARYIRSSMVVALGQPYVSVARAKGLPERRVVVRHALRNSLVPFTSLLSLEMGGVIGASLAADGVFGAGGLASAFLSAVGNADPFLLTAIFTVTAFLVCGFAFVGDLVVGWLDPRARTVTAS